MAKVLPYRAFFYDKSSSGDLSKLVSPPYDVINESYRQELLARSPYNSVQLCLVDDPQDPSRYDKMKGLFQEWKKKQILGQTEKPAFYLIEDQFELDGQLTSRIGFVGLLEVSAFEKHEVLPHEHTLSGPKLDRLNLLKVMGAELSQIFMVYRDPKLILEQIYKAKKNEPPYAELCDDLHIKRRLWLIEDPNSLSSIQNLLSEQQLLIADGHHRYETALALYREEASERNRYAQAYFTNLENPNFVILPIHRIIQLPESMDEATFKSKLEKIFKLSPIRAGKLQDALKCGSGDALHMIVSFGDNNEHYLLERDRRDELDLEIFSLHRDIFEGLLDWDVSKLAKGWINYEHTEPDYLKRLQSLTRSVGFFLPPTDLKAVIHFARQGQRMPQKSTFFYPKLASGLVTYELGNP